MPIISSKYISEFKTLSLSHGHLMSHTDDEFSMDLYGWSDNDIFQSKQYELNCNSTSYGYVQNGKCKIYNDKIDCSFELCQGMYFSIPANQKYIIEPLSDNNNGIIINQNKYIGIFNIGGPIESIGRLKYIDGCTDNLLLSPILFGDPCLNVLYFIKNLSQTPHTHPSFRIGIVTNGFGYCCLENGQKVELVKDLIFFIPKDVLHSFETDIDNELTVIAFHPDSDFGPKHEQHPMINRTMVNDISASQIIEIHTN